LLSDLIKDKDFALVMKQHILDILVYLFDSNKNFGILCNIDDVTFDPQLPEIMQESFAPLTLFFLAGYTYDSAYIEDDYIVFEAGFGSENFGSVVHVPLLSIVHIIVDETPIFINLSEIRNIDTQTVSQDKQLNEKSVENSMNVFLSNPENQKFFD